MKGALSIVSIVSRGLAGALGLLLCVGACGSRTELFEGSPPSVTVGGPDSGGFFDSGARDAAIIRRDAAPPRDAGDVDASPFLGCSFQDSFESGTGAWVLGARWALSSNSVDGNMSLRGSWDDFAVGCETTSAAKMAVDVSLVGVTSAALSFLHSGEACALDTLRVVVSTDGGASWATAATASATTLLGWAAQVIDLAPWAGEPTVRFGFEFYNGCGDPCGVTWFVDRVSIACTPR